MAQALASSGGPLRPVLLSLANGGLAPAWDCPDLEGWHMEAGRDEVIRFSDLEGWHMEAGRDEVIRFFREREAYLDKELRPMPKTPEPDGDEQDEPSMVMFDFEIGDKVWMADAQDGPAGRVVRLIVDPGETMYVVTWSDTRCTITHYAFELSKEKPVSL